MDGRFWPGGIPSTVRSHPEPLDDSDFEVLTRGFRLFIRENWIPREEKSEPDQGFGYEDNQRRKLVETWACAQQDFREDYQKSASDNDKPFNRYHTPDDCLRGLPVDVELSHCYCIAFINGPEDHGRMLKCILLSCVWDQSAMSYFPPSEPVSMLPPNPVSGPITVDNFRIARLVECPDFTNMGMTVDGTTVFPWGENDILIDNHTLETGLLLMNKSRPDGSSYFSARVQPQDLNQIWGKIIGLGWGLPEAVEGANPSDEPFDLRLPLIEILLPRYDDPSVTREDLIERIEEIAPGYLEAEEAGNGFAGEYDIGQIEWEL